MEQSKAAIFDMDGLLINSEPFWREAEINIFHKLGVPMTESMCESVMGIRIDEVVDHWFHQYPWEGPDQHQVKEMIIREVERLIFEKGEALPGVYDILKFFKKKDFKIALASSSSYRLINAVLDKLQIRDYFEVIQSAERLKFGKPHPEIFIYTKDKLNVRYSNCIVFEDSIMGVVAAKASRMKVVAVPDLENLNPQFCLADLTLKSLENFSESHLSDLL